jgi:hypothetical protein
MSDPIEAALEATRRRIASPAWADDFALPAPVGIELDGLADEVSPSEWSPGRRATMAALRAIRPRQKLAVLSMACNEAPFLPEWIAHYRAIGADRIFIYTNDNSDGTDTLLRWFSNCTPVVPIFTTAAPGVNVQFKNYEHALFLLPELRLYDWVLVVDADEFLVPAARYSHHLPTLLAHAPADTDSVIFPWRWRHWDRRFARGPGLLAERYPHAHDTIGFKSAIRLGRVSSLRNVHAPILEEGGVERDSAFNVVRDAWAPEQRTAEGGWIDHYWGKSFEEFVVKKRRGESLALESGLFKRAYEDFFSWADRLTPENLSPVPGPVVEAVKAGLARFEARADYRELKSQLERRYEANAEILRNDPELRRLYDAAMQEEGEMTADEA